MHGIQHLLQGISKTYLQTIVYPISICWKVSDVWFGCSLSPKEVWDHYQEGVNGNFLILRHPQDCQVFLLFHDFNHCILYLDALVYTCKDVVDTQKSSKVACINLDLHHIFLQVFRWTENHLSNNKLISSWIKPWLKPINANTIWYPLLLHLRYLLHQRFHLTQPLVRESRKGRRLNLVKSIHHGVNVMRKPFLEHR